MHPVRGALALLVWGLLLDAVDLRVGRFDLLPDVVGLALVVVGLKDLSAHLPGLRRVRQVAVVAAALSLADLVHPLETTVEGGGGSAGVTTTTTAAVAPTGPWGLASGLHEVAVALLLVLLCRAAVAASRAGGWSVVAEVFQRLVLWNGVLLAVTLLAAAAGVLLGEEARQLGLLLAPVVVVGLVLRVWTVARLWGLREGPPLVQPDGAEQGATAAGRS